MFLSMVIEPNAPFTALTTDSASQRFNVATSRARDQVFLFHSIRLDDIKNTNCVRYKLLNWYLNPPLAEMEAGLEILRQRAESPFEIEVGERIIKKGYKVIPQFIPLPNDSQYRIDLVIQGNNNRLAVECDGDRYHGPDKWEHDQRRESQLRRAGWKFWRISGSTFYRNKDKALESLWQFLEVEGIEPILFTRQSENHKYSESSKSNASSEKFTVTSDKEDINKDSTNKAGNYQTPSESTKFTLTLPENPSPLFSKVKIPSLSNNWRVWFEISEWGKKTMAISDYWWGFAKEISDRLKEKKDITPKQKENMNRCWKTAFKKGFSSSGS